jgi:cobaltochelatase CobS
MDTTTQAPDRSDLIQWSESAPVQKNLFSLMVPKQADADNPLENLPVDAFAITTGNTPEQKLYLFTQEQMFDLWAWLQTDKPLYIWGPTGCGKSTIVEQLAARLRIPVFNLTGSFDTDVQDFYGSRTAVNGTVFYEYGPLSLAYRHGGIFLLDEIDGLNPALALGLNTVLDGRPIVIAETGEIIHRHPRFRFVATANTNGGSDETGLYQGTNRLNLAFMDRFFKLEAKYPAPAVEKVLLKLTAPAISVLHDSMVEYANMVREAFMNGESNIQMDVTISTRTLLAWAELIQVYQPMRTKVNVMEYTLMRVLGNMASETCRVALVEILQRINSSHLFSPQSVSSQNEEKSHDLPF